MLLLSLVITRVRWYNVGAVSGGTMFISSAMSIRHGLNVGILKVRNVIMSNM